jgi:glutathione synthase/RimK-type ligase-like ATP-grasp enzyme
MSPAVDARAAAPVVLATCKELPALHDDDAPLLEALAAREVPVRIRAWDDPSVDWSAAALVVVRSTWDYVPRRADFVAWARRVATVTTLWNPADVLAWNTDKRYLRRLADAGVPTVPTRWLHQGAAVQLGAVLDEAGWSDAVVKPAVSAGSVGTVRLKRREARRVQAHLDALLAEGDALVQPYLDRIESVGEISVHWIDGQVTHAVRKRPRAGDFRVQAQFGGREEPVALGPGLSTAAAEALAHAGMGCRYARVDLVEGPAGERWLIELELVEPQLFLRHCPAAAGRLADAIAGAWRRTARGNQGARG